MTTTTTTNSTIPKSDINYDSLQEINQKINMKLQQKSINRSSLLLSSFHNTYYPNKNNQLSLYMDRSSSSSSLSSSKRINPTLNWYLLNLKLKQRIYYLNDHDHDHDPTVQQKNKKKFFLINSYSDEFINEKSNDKSKTLSYNRQLLENVTQLPPMATSSSSASSPLSPQQQQQQEKKKKKQQRQRQQQHRQQQHQQQHSKTWNGKKPKRNLILEEWKRKSDTVQNFTNIENVSFSTKVLTIRFWNGDELKLDPLPSEKLGDVIRSHLSDLTIPIQCIDLMSKEYIPWETPTLQLSSKTLLIKKIHKNKVTPPGIHPTRKMERRSAPPFDTTSGALKNWFDFYKKSNSMNSYSLSDQLINDCLCELNPNVLVNLLGGRQKLFDENSPTPTPLSAISSLDEIFRHRSNSYSRVEEIQHQNLPNNQPFDSQDLASLFFIEESWEQIVKSSSKMTKQQQKRQSAIWEFIYTEANYIKYLRTIIDYYLAPFLEIRESLFENLDTGWIFGNIEEIFKANIKLWLQYLTEPLREIRRNGDAFTPVIFKSAITHIPDLFSVYKQYYVNLSRCRSYTQEAVRQSTNFCTFLEWADQQGHDHREPLWDQLTKPTTRLTQYRLLMESIRKNCCNSTEEQEVSEMFNSISEFIEEINQQMMTETKTWESLELLASKLICCDFLDNNVDDYTQLISDYSRFKFSILSPIKLPSPVILFNDYHSISQSIPSCTKSLAFLRNRRLSGSPLFTSNNSISDARTILNHNTTSCNRSDSGIGDCNQTLSTSSSTTSRDYTSPTGFKQRSRIYSLTNPATESFSFPVMLSRISEGGKIQKSISLDTEFSDSISYDWSDIHYRRTIQRTVLYGGNLRFKEPPNRSIETVCHILTDLFLITKQHKKDGNDYWKLIKNPIRLDKLIIQRGRETGVFGCAILDDFHNIANLYIFSAGPKCDEWITQIESAKENYRKLMEPEVLIVQPLMKYQRDDLSTIIMSPDSMCSSDNISELHNQPYGHFVDTTPTSGNSINSGKNINIEGNKRNVFFESQSPLFESINCNHTNHNNQTDSMCIIDKRIRSNNSPTIMTNHQRSSSRSCNYTSIERDSTKMIHSTSVRNLSISNTSDRHLLHLSSNLTEASKSTTSHSPLRRDVAKKFFLSSNQNGQKYFSMNYQNEPRFPRDLSDQRLKSGSSNLDLDKVSHTIPIRQSSRFTSSAVINNNDDCNINQQDHCQSSNSTLSSSSSSSSLTSLKTEMKVPVNYPSIVICKVQSDSDEIINSNDNNRYLLSTGLQRSSVHHSLLNIERSDSSEDQITIKL